MLQIILHIWISNMKAIVSLILNEFNRCRYEDWSNQRSHRFHRLQIYCIRARARACVCVCVCVYINWNIIINYPYVSSSFILRKIILNTLDWIHIGQQSSIIEYSMLLVFKVLQFFYTNLLLTRLIQNKLCSIFIDITTRRTHLSHSPTLPRRATIHSKFYQAKRNYRHRTFDKTPHGKSVLDETTSKNYRKL